MRPWQFGKPKTPGFGISKGYYLTVLSSTAVLPSILRLVNPKSDEGAVPGFGAPLMQGADKSVLSRPMERGAYVVASKDRKTVLKLTVISKEEAQFDPEAFARSAYALEASQELLNRMRATWTLAQLTFESHDPMVYPALDFFLGVAARLGQLTDGVVADPISQRYELPEQVFSPLRTTERLAVYADEHVAIKFRVKPDGLHAYTLGLQKFALPELELMTLLDSDQSAAILALSWLTQQILMGQVVQAGYEVGGRKMPFEVREGGFDRGLWEGVPVFELLPPTSETASDALREWSETIASQLR